MAQMEMPIIHRLSDASVDRFQVQFLFCELAANGC